MSKIKDFTNKAQISCEELPGVIITKLRARQIKKIQNMFLKNPDIKKYHEHFLYHLKNYGLQASRRGEFLGFVLLAPKSSYSKENEILHLSLVYVVEKHRLQGIGSFLFFAANTLSKAMGYKSIYLDITKDLPDSEAFCKAMFKHIKELNGTVTNTEKL